MRTRAHDTVMRFELGGVELYDLQRQDGSDKCLLTSKVGVATGLEVLFRGRHLLLRTQANRQHHRGLI